MTYATPEEMARALVRTYSNAAIVRKIILESFPRAPSIRSIAAMRGQHCKMRKIGMIGDGESSLVKNHRRSQFDQWAGGDSYWQIYDMDMRAGSARLLAALRKNHTQILKRLSSQGLSVVW